MPGETGRIETITGERDGMKGNGRFLRFSLDWCGRWVARRAGVMIVFAMGAHLDEGWRVRGIF